MIACAGCGTPIPYRTKNYMPQPRLRWCSSCTSTKPQTYEQELARLVTRFEEKCARIRAQKRWTLRFFANGIPARLYRAFEEVGPATVHDAAANAGINHNPRNLSAMVCQLRRDGKVANFDTVPRYIAVPLALRESTLLQCCAKEFLAAVERLGPIAP